MAIVKSEEKALVDDPASLSPAQVSQIQQFELERWKKSCRNSSYLCKEVHFNSLAREWRCKWSIDDRKRSLTECQKVLEEVAVPALRKVRGLLGVQRVVCGECQDFKVIIKMGLDAFEDWAATNFYPEVEVIQDLYCIEGVSKVEVQTFSLEPIFGPGK
eukprot:TRINITY_DN70071_c0_g1_i1.p1 TRINITY_DN70071_c0_g1~~TRINITY_DN70071_c0_g1_i1.p1  ORF type:complete len:159 (-),score=35.54 TRINITY_DN70071_c0_g1_i1:63-539(-)